MVAGVGIEPTRAEGYEASLASLRARIKKKLVQEVGLEPTAARLSVECSAI